MAEFESALGLRLVISTTTSSSSSITFLLSILHRPLEGLINPHSTRPEHRSSARKDGDTQPERAFDHSLPFQLIPQFPDAASNIHMAEPSFSQESTPPLAASSLSSLSDSVISTPTASPSRSPSILRSNTLPPSEPAPPISFAPLPVIAPRRRRSNIQLGVAARNRLLRARRGQIDDDDYHNENAPYPPPIPTPRVRLLTPRAWEDDPDEDEDEDPDAGVHKHDPAEDAILAFGRFVKGASRNFWHRVARRPRGAEAAEEIAVGGDAAEKQPGSEPVGGVFEVDVSVQEVGALWIEGSKGPTDEKPMDSTKTVER